jgi:hypothetical protein
MTSFNEAKYQELSNSPIDELDYLTDIDKVKKLALLLRAELYRSHAETDSLQSEMEEFEKGRKACDALDTLEAERDHYKKGYELSNNANIHLLEIIRDINIDNLDSYKAEVQQLFPTNWTDKFSDKINKPQ